MKTPMKTLIEQLKEEKHTYMMQEHHPLELSIIEDCFDSAIMKATELLEKEREVEERCREVFELGASAFQECLNPHTLEFDHETFKRLKEEAVNQNK